MDYLINMAAVNANEDVSDTDTMSAAAGKQLNPLMCRVLAATQNVMGGLALLLANIQIAYGISSYQGLLGGFCVSNLMLNTSEMLSEPVLVF